jgi:hypothetical protein
MSDVAAAHREAEQALADGDGRRAFTVLRPVLERVDELDRRNWCAAFALFARISDDVGAGQLAGLARAAADQATDTAAMYQLGYELIEQGLHRVAAGVLERANRLAPGQTQIVSELVAALEGVGDHARACAVLRADESLLREQFIFRYLLAFNTIMRGDLGEARRLTPTLEPATDDDRWMAARIGCMLARADAVGDVCALDGDDLRGWHFVLTGGLLLHVSPFGPEVMRGRYAFVQDTEDRCLEGIRRLGAALEALEYRPPRILGLPDRNSMALAIAAAREFGRHVEPLNDTTLDAPGLVIAYDLDSVDDEVLGGLAVHRPGQVLWTHASRWTVDQPVAADLTTYLHQVNVGPWDEGRMRVDPDGDGVVHTAAVTAEPEELADRVLRAEPEPTALDDVVDLIALARAAATARGAATAAALRSAGRRERQWKGGPVHSNQFA